VKEDKPALHACWPAVDAMGNSRCFGSCKIRVDCRDVEHSGVAPDLNPCSPNRREVRLVAETPRLWTWRARMQRVVVVAWREQSCTKYCPRGSRL
jgi:predicted nucleic acid-binding Zn ribbon protein